MCQFLMYSKMTQANISFFILSSFLVCPKRLNIASCAIQWDLKAWLLFFVVTYHSLSSYEKQVVEEERI